MFYLIVERLSVAHSAWFTVVATTTLIGFLYTGVGRTERAAFAVSSVLLMTPGLLVDVGFDLCSARHPP